MAARRKVRQIDVPKIKIFKKLFNLFDNFEKIRSLKILKFLMKFDFLEKYDFFLYCYTYLTGS